MNLKEQLYVVTIAECRSITKAAEKLHVSQPALSAFIGNIENTIGLKLFDRFSREVIPTYYGELYIQTAKRMLLLQSEFDEILSDLKADHKGRFRIGMQRRRSPLIMPSLYREFNRIYPNVELFFVEDVIELLEEMLSENELDLILCNKIHEMKTFEYVRITGEHLLLATSSEHRLIGNAIRLLDSPYDWIDLQLFEGETFILQRPGQTQRNLSDAQMKKMKVAPGHIIEVQNIETSTRMSALGIGVSFALETYAKHFLFEPEPCYFIVGPNQEQPPHAAEFVAVRKKGSYMPAYVETAIDIVKKNL